MYKQIHLCLQMYKCLGGDVLAVDVHSFNYLEVIVHQNKGILQHIITVYKTESYLCD